MARDDRYVLSTAAGRSHELIEIGGRQFKAHPFSLRETDEIDEAGSLYDTVESLVGPLNARIDGDPIDADFLMDHVTKPFLTDLLRLLVNGRLETDPKR